MPLEQLYSEENVPVLIYKETKTAPEQELKYSGPVITGFHQKFIKALIWINIFFLILKRFISLPAAIKKIKKILHLRNLYRDNNTIIKYAKNSNRYFYSFNAPGWPSKAFNRYITHQLYKLDDNDKYTGIHTLIFGITNKCGYKCEHCFEWKNLNRPESLTREELVSVITKFQDAHVSQVQLSGGEPLNRLKDIFYILKNAKKGTDFWIYTSGYHLTNETAKNLKAQGLTGVAISLDHWDPYLHDLFRGKQGAFDWVNAAAINAGNNGLAVCLSLCATKKFITAYNLDRYAKLAKKLKVSFIQILEPKAVGHYEGTDVTIDEEQIVLLEDFYNKMNYAVAYKNYPSVVYHGFYSRRVGCTGSAKDYLYVDMDGDAHACPFCQNKKFNVLTCNLPNELSKMKNNDCMVYPKSKW